MALFHHVPHRVAWPETDPAGIAWFGNYMRWFEDAEEELFIALGEDRSSLLRRLNVWFPRTSLQCGFRSPAKLGDEVQVGVGVADITDRRVQFAFDIRERGTDRLICEASYRVACVDAATFAAMPIPSEVASFLARAKV